ncbi:MAG TPA: GNAT family N-acetyltransferase [bacterium]|nr:GNAT family N-acetyltransferase [bacterium]HOM26651.1 GNAT family N-acetyltransferase [bacterium]
MKQLRMVLPKSKNFERIEIPDGYEIRNFERGDEEEYISLLSNNELGEWNLEKLQKTILDNTLSPEGIFFCVYSNKIIGTACGLDKGFYNNRKIAELGWVCVDKNHRGKGLGYFLCFYVIQFLRKRKYEIIYLLTDPFRIGAIKTYFKLGFVPVIESEEDFSRWDEVSKNLNLKIDYFLKSMDLFKFEKIG